MDFSALIAQLLNGREAQARGLSLGNGFDQGGFLPQIQQKAQLMQNLDAQAAEKEAQRQALLQKIAAELGPMPPGFEEKIQLNEGRDSFRQNAAKRMLEGGI